MNDQDASGIANPVTSDLARHLGRMVEDAMLDYPGGMAKAELVKNHPDFSLRLHKMIDTLAGEQALCLPLVNRPIWKTLRSSRYNPEDYLADITGSKHVRLGRKIHHLAVNMMTRPDFQSGMDVVSVKLAKATGRELTGSGKPTTAEVYASIDKFGGKLCPAWVGPELWKQYSDQPSDEVMIVAMETIRTSGGSLYVFQIKYNGRIRRLGCGSGYPNRRWNGDHHWVFAIP